MKDAEFISSRQNKLVIKVCGLSEKKNRDAEKIFRFDGIKLYKEAICTGIELVYLLVKESCIDRIDEIVREYPPNRGCRKIILSDGVFEKITSEKSPEGIISVAKYIDKSHKIIKINSVGSEIEALMSEKGSVMLLEDVADPGNLGTVIRTAAALGIELLIISKNCADMYNPKTVRAAMGSLFRQRITVAEDMCEVIEILKAGGRRVLAAMPGANAMTLGKSELRYTDCVVIGNEGHGITEKTEKACTDKICIPMVEGNESLNAATAASVFMWELSKITF